MVDGSGVLMGHSSLGIGIAAAASASSTSLEEEVHLQRAFQPVILLVDPESVLDAAKSNRVPLSTDVRYWLTKGAVGAGDA